MVSLFWLISLTVASFHSVNACDDIEFSQRTFSVQKIIDSPYLSAWPNHDFGGVYISPSETSRLSRWLLSTDKLKSLGFRYSTLDNSSFRELLSALTLNHSLESVDLAYTNLTKELVEPMVSLIKQSEQIKKVDLTGVMLNESSLNKIIESLADARAVTSINLSGLYFTANCTKVLADNIARNIKTTELSLNAAGLFVDNLKQLAPAFKTNTFLNKLSLSHNNFQGPSAGEYLAEIIHNGNLTYLELQNCNLSSSTIETLISTLKHYETVLRHRPLKKNFFGHLIESKQQFLVIDLRYNRLDSFQLNQLWEAFGFFKNNVKLIY